MTRTSPGSVLKWLRSVVENADTDECIISPFGVSQNGYGSGTPWNGRKQHIHVVACEIAHGPKPFSGMECAHSCGVRKCVNPRHLRWDTHANNMAEQVAHRTKPMGEKHKNAKLTESDVRRIREDKGARRHLADEMGVAYTTICKIKSRKAWSHII